MLIGEDPYCCLRADRSLHCRRAPASPRRSSAKVERAAELAYAVSSLSQYEQLVLTLELLHARGHMAIHGKRNNSTVRDAAVRSEHASRTSPRMICGIGSAIKWRVWSRCIASHRSWATIRSTLVGGRIC